MESDEGIERYAQGSEAPCTPTREKGVVEEEMSEVGSVRSLQSAQDERTYDGDEQYENEQRVEAMQASAAMEEMSDDGAAHHQVVRHSARRCNTADGERGYSRKFHRREREQQP